MGSPGWAPRFTDDVREHSSEVQSCIALRCSPISGPSDLFPLQLGAHLQCHLAVSSCYYTVYSPSLETLQFVSRREKCMFPSLYVITYTWKLHVPFHRDQ